MSKPWEDFQSTGSTQETKPWEDFGDKSTAAKTVEPTQEEPSVGQFLLHALSGNNLGMVKHAPAVMDLLKKVPGMVAEGGPPAIGAAVGGSLGAALGPPGVIGGAALGGAAGGLANRVFRQQAMGEPAPSLPNAALQTAIDAAGGATQEAAPMVKEAANIGPVVDKTVKKELTRAIKPGINKPNFQENLGRSVPDVAAMATAKKAPIQNSEDLLKLIPETKKEIWSQYAQKLAGAGDAAVIDGNKIADAMIGTISKRFRTMNPKGAEAIEKLADTYRRPIPATEAEDFLHGVNDELASYYGKNKVGRDLASRDPEIAHTVKEGDTLREELYSLLDKLPGKDAAELKRRYGALTELQDALLKRKPVADRANADSLAEQISFARGAGNVLESAANLHGGTALKGVGTMVAARYLKNRNQFDNVIERAFQRYNSGLQDQPFLSPNSIKVLTNLARSYPNSDKQTP